MTVDIIGAGIGGLTTAIALRQKGFQVRVFEQAAQLKRMGAGIILAHNAMQVYDKLGLRQVIEENGQPISAMNITRPNLKPLSKVDLTRFERQYNTQNIAIHRGTLQQILLDQLSSIDIHLNYKLTSLIKSANGYDLTFENGKQIQSSTLLGADGLHSIIRQKLFSNNSIRNANQICWRGIASYNLPAHLTNELNEAWGKKGRFGFVPIGANKVYWYALKSFKKDQNGYSIDTLETYFDDFNPVVRDLIKSTKKEQIHTAEISDLKPTNNWYKDAVCLIGDAAHATTPNMGQGACQAIEDAYILSECLCQYETNEAFKQYQKLRLPKAHQVVKASWSIGKLAHLTHPISIGFRNQILQLMPNSVSRKQNERIFELATI